MLICMLHEIQSDPAKINTQWQMGGGFPGQQIQPFCSFKGHEEKAHPLFKPVSSFKMQQLKSDMCKHS